METIKELINSAKAWIQEIEWIFGVIVTVTVTVFTVFKWLFEDELRRNLKKRLPLCFVGLFSSNKQENRLLRNKVTPEDIMHDRGRKENGFRQDLFFETTAFRSFLEKMRTNANIVVIKGNFASGKSRMVWEYLQCDDDTCPYTYVRIPNLDETGVDEICNMLKGLGKKEARTTLLILDDIDRLFTTDADDVTDSVNPLMKTIHQKRVKSIVTIVDHIDGANMFGKKCERGNNAFRPADSSMNEIPIVSIAEIEKGDDTYNWCIGNLKNNGYSTVIGGYIPEIQRSIDPILSKLSDEEKRVLTTYHVARKFRRNEGGNIENLKCLHLCLWNGQEDPVPAIMNNLIRKDFFSRMEAENGTYYEIKNQQLYSTFFSRAILDSETDRDAADGDLSPCRYLLPDPRHERLQVDAYLTSAGDDDAQWAMICSRCMTHCQFREETLPYLSNIMWERINARGHTTPIPQHYVDNPIVDYVRYYTYDGYLCIQGLIDEGRIKPTIMLVSNIYTAALRDTEHRKEMEDYANRLIAKYSIPKDSIYFYSEVELADPEFSIERAQACLQLYQNCTGSEREYIFYCQRLLQKANTVRTMNILWHNIVPHVRLRLSDSFLMRHVTNISNQQNRADQLICTFFTHFCLHLDDVELITRGEGDRRAIALLKVAQRCIARSKTYTQARQLMDMAFQRFQETGLSTTSTGFSQNFYSILTIELFKKIGSRTQNIEDAFQLLKNRIKDLGHEVRSAHRLCNAFLSQMPSYEDAKHHWDIIEKDHWLIGGLSIDTVCTLLNAVKEDVRKSIPRENWQYTPTARETRFNSELEARIFEALLLREEIASDQMRHNTQYDTIVYAIARNARLAGAGDDTVKKIKRYAQDDHDNPITQLARITAIIDRTEAMAKIDEVTTIIRSGKQIDSDFVTNLLFMHTIHFRHGDSDDNEMRQKLAYLIEQYDKKVRVPSFHYCKEKLYFKLQDASRPALKIIKDWIADWNRQLLMYGIPLTSDHENLYTIAILHSNVTVCEALELLLEAEKVSHNHISEEMQRLWNPNLITFFLEKNLKQCEPMPFDQFNNALKDIQMCINKNLYVDYSTESRHIVQSLKKLKNAIYKRSIGLNFPLTSIDATIRRRIWNFYSRENELGSIADNVLDMFIKQEENYLKHYGKTDNPRECEFREAALAEQERRREDYTKIRR